MQLNFPDFPHQLKKINNSVAIWDVIRKKYVALAPEEWVRQHLIHFLIGQGYPKGLIQVEIGHRYNSLQKRSDVVVFGRDGAPYLLVECKAPNILLTQPVFEQAIWYNTQVKASYLMLTNGMEHLYYRCWPQGWEPLQSLPIYPG